MSYTNSDIITAALRDLCVISEIQTPSAEQASHALAELNDLMAELEEDGLKMGWFEQTTTSDPFPVPAPFKSGIAASLAARLAPNYGATVSIELAAKLDNGMSVIKRALIKAPEVDLLNRPVGSGNYGTGYDITRG